MRTFWLVWFVVFLAGEAYALYSGVPTLSQFWRELRDLLPLWLSTLLAGSTAATFFWLLGPHWLFSGFDRAGFDRNESLAVLLGFVWGVLGTLSARRNLKKPLPEEGPD